VTIKALHLNTTKGRLIGLMFMNKIVPVFLQTRFGIHTCFVKHPISVFILDGDLRIVKIKKSLRPWRIFFWNPKYQNVLELSKESFDKHNFKIGTKLKMKLID